jgi:hypothetical protein
MKKTLEIVDGFYGNPMRQRERALASVSAKQNGERRSASGDAGSSHVADDEAARRIAEILGLAAGSSPATVRGYMAFRDRDARDPLATPLAQTDWAGIVCLSEPEECAGSIWFYRRSQVPQRETLSIPMRFNRMVLFRPSELGHGVRLESERASGPGLLTQILAVDGGPSR